MIVLAHMVSPTNEARRKELIAPFSLLIYVPTDELAMLDLQPLLAPMRRARREAEVDAQTAAMVLHTIRSAEASGEPKLATINMAYRNAAAKRQDADIPTISQNTLKRQFTAYRSVAHLWAAEVYLRRPYWNGNWFNAFDNSWLLLLLGIAESLRKWGERPLLHRWGDPATALLPPNSTWRLEEGVLPDGYEADLMFRGLTEWERDKMRSKKIRI
jgi:hypothetical protein